MTNEMIKLNVELPESIYNMLLELLDEFEKETGITPNRDMMIAGTIRVSYMMRQ